MPPHTCSLERKATTGIEDHTLILKEREVDYKKISFVVQHNQTCEDDQVVAAYLYMVCSFKSYTVWLLFVPINRLLAPETSTDTNHCLHMHTLTSNPPTPLMK